MNVLSLFDGMSCGMIALERTGIEVNRYYASEIDKNAEVISKDNYPDIIRVGDVTKWREWDIDWSSVDLLIGGSPCQGFSICGNRLEFDDKRSSLIQCYFDILNHIKKVNGSVKFLLENVKMSKSCEAEISRVLGVQPMRINSKLVSAQMRDRLYWFNWEVDQPADKSISFQSILESGYVEKEKSWCMLEAWNRFPTSTESVKKRYKRSMMPVIFSNKECDFSQGWREPTISECERLQCVDVGYTKAIAPKRAKGVLGNGWTVDVIAHIFESINKD